MQLSLVSIAAALTTGVVRIPFPPPVPSKLFIHFTSLNPITFLHRRSTFPLYWPDLQVAIPTSLVHAGITARDGGYDRWNGIYCTNPCPKCNLEKISPADLIVQAYTIDINQSYCVTSDGSDYPDAAGNWRLLNGCGPNNAAIWLQSYVSIEPFILLPCCSGRQMAAPFNFLQPTYTFCSPDSSIFFWWHSIPFKSQKQVKPLFTSFS